MATLQDILANAQRGGVAEQIASAYGLTPEQAQQAVDSLLPAISLGLKQSTATPEGLGELFTVAGKQPNLDAMYEDPTVAFSPESTGSISGSDRGWPDRSRPRRSADGGRHLRPDSDRTRKSHSGWARQAGDRWTLTSPVASICPVNRLLRNKASRKLLEAATYFGQILREVLGQGVVQGQTSRQGLMDSAGGAGSLVFGDALETGTTIAQAI